jgi:hypothetical protein
MRLEIKRIDKARVPSTGKWIVSDSREFVPEIRMNEYAAYEEYVFIIQRTIVQTEGSNFPDTSFTILIQSDCLRRVVKEVMKDVQKLSWHGQPLKVL